MWVCFMFGFIDVNSKWGVNSNLHVGMSSGRFFDALGKPTRLDVLVYRYIYAKVSRSMLFVWNYFGT